MSTHGPLTHNGLHANANLCQHDEHAGEQAVTSHYAEQASIQRNVHSEIEQSSLELLTGAGLVRPELARMQWQRNGRHRTALVQGPDGAAWLVKQCGAPMITGPVSLGGECRFHRFVACERPFPMLRQHMPQLLYHAEDGERLIFTGYPRHTSMYLCLKQGWFDSAIVEQIAACVAQLHSATVPEKEELAQVACPVVTHGRVTPTQLMNRPGVYKALLRLMQATPGFNASLRFLRGAWQHNGMIHGDLKLDNVLISSRGTPETSAFFIIDWELAGVGDIAWDCGSLIGSLYFALLEQRHSGAHVDATDAPDGSYDRTIRLFIEAYSRCYTRLNNRAPNLGLILAWAGYWLVQQVVAQLPLRRRLTRLDLAAMHLAQQLLAEGNSASKQE